MLMNFENINVKARVGSATSENSRGNINSNLAFSKDPVH